MKRDMLPHDAAKEMQRRLKPLLQDVEVFFQPDMDLAHKAETDQSQPARSDWHKWIGMLVIEVVFTHKTRGGKRRMPYRAAWKLTPDDRSRHSRFGDEWLLLQVEGLAMGLLEKVVKNTLGDVPHGT